MKKKIAAALLCTALILQTTACGSQPGQTQPAPESTGQQETPEENTETENAATQNDTDVPNADGAQAGAGDSAQNTPAADDTGLAADSIGPVSFTPNENGYYMVYGSNTLHAYFKRHNVIPGTGKLTVRKTADDSVVEEIDLNDTDKCTIGEQDSTFHLLGWDGGTHLIIRLQDVPAAGEAYYINLEEGAFTSQDGTIRSKPITDNTTWRYGVAAFGVIPSRPNGSDVFVGDTFSADILVRPPAAMARVENYDENRVRFNEKEFVQDGKLEIKIYQIGDDPFTVTFFDEEENPIGSITLTYTASMPPEPEEEAPRKSVTDL